MKNKKIEEYILPNSYKMQILDFYYKVKNILKEELELFVLTGSCGIEKVNVYWSDIDVLIVINYYKFIKIKKIFKILEKYEIKLGVTIYSKKEFENCYLDGKTKYNLFLLKKGILKINYKSKNINIPNITLKNLKDNDKKTLYESVHKVKRILSLYKEEDKKALIKNLNLILKIKLLQKNIIALGYKEIFLKFSEIYNFDSYEIVKELNKESIDKNLLEYSEKIIEYLCDNMGDDKNDV